MQYEDEFQSLAPLGFPKYSINRNGDVINNETRRPKYHSINQYGTRFVTMYQGNARKSRQVATLVAETFLREEFPREWDTLIYLNGDKADVKAANLAYRPRAYAIRYNTVMRDLDDATWTLAHASEEWTGVTRQFDNLVDSSKCYGVLPWEIMSAIDNGDSPVFAPGVIFHAL